ncbi:MAG: 30S ribosomal protein S18 [bacterium]
MLQQKKECFFCTANIKSINYKDIDILRRFVTPQARIIRRKRTGACAKHQRALTKAIKRARNLALLPFVTQ